MTNRMITGRNWATTGTQGSSGSAIFQFFELAPTILCSAASSRRDRALVEEELPAIVAEDPERRAMGDSQRGRGPIGCQGNILCKALDIKVMNGSCTRFTVEQNIDGLLAIEHAARHAKLFVFIGEERDQRFAVSLAVGMEQTLLKRVKMILKFRALHAGSQLLYGQSLAGFQERRRRILARSRTCRSSRERNAGYLLQILVKRDVLPRI